MKKVCAIDDCWGTRDFDTGLCMTHHDQWRCSFQFARTVAWALAAKTEQDLKKSNAISRSAVIEFINTTNAEKRNAVT